MVSEMVRLCAKPHPPFHPEGFSGGAKTALTYGLIARAGDGQRSLGLKSYSIFRSSFTPLIAEIFSSIRFQLYPVL